MKQAAENKDKPLLRAERLSNPEAMRLCRDRGRGGGGVAVDLWLFVVNSSGCFQMKVIKRSVMDGFKQKSGLHR